MLNVAIKMFKFFALSRILRLQVVMWNQVLILGIKMFKSIELGEADFCFNKDPIIVDLVEFYFL